MELFPWNSMEFCLVLGMEFYGKRFPLNSIKNAVSMEFHRIEIISMENVFHHPHGIYEKWSFHGIPWKTVFYEIL